MQTRCLKDGCVLISRFCVVWILLIGAAFESFGQPSTNGLFLWLDSRIPGSILTNTNGTVSSWLNNAPGMGNAVTYSGANDNGTAASYNTNPPTLVAGIHGFPVVNFNGNGYLDNLNFSSATPVSATVFVVASAATNAGNYSAWLSFRAAGQNDYQTGMNMDQGQNPSSTFNRLNVEGSKAGGGGGFQFANGALQFNTFYLFEIDYGGGPAETNDVVTVLVDGVSQVTLNGNTNTVNLSQCYIGTRAYVSGFVPNSNHDAVGQISAVLAYDHQLTGTNLTQTLSYLLSFFAVPELSIAKVGTNSVVVFWPNTGNYALHQSPALTGGWTTSSYPVTTANGTNSVTISPPTNSLYFRLSYP